MLTSSNIESTLTSIPNITLLIISQEAFHALIPSI
jgi:hypothetical protein